MPIDRTGRDRLRNALIGYMQMHTTSKPFEMCDVEFFGSKNPDRSLVLIADVLYNIFDDFSDHLILPDRKRVELLLRNPWPDPTDDDFLRKQKESWVSLCRIQAFLKTDFELDPTLKSPSVRRDHFIAFFPFASAEDAEKHKASWLDFTPPFDPAMMTSEFKKARRDMKVLQRLPYWWGLGYVIVGLLGWYCVAFGHMDWRLVVAGGIPLVLIEAARRLRLARHLRVQNRSARCGGGDGG